MRTGGAHDLVVLSGVEPHLAWPTYVGLRRARSSTQLGCEAVVTVGATADAVPHTRMPPVVGSTADPELARRLALSAPTYQGITGLIGVLHAELERARRAVDLAARRRAPLPRPRRAPAGRDRPDPPPRPRARRPADRSTSPSRADRWAAQHDEVVGDDEQLRLYVRMLEIEYDRRAEATLRTADDIAARFEEFLREQRDPTTDGSDAS